MSRVSLYFLASLVSGVSAALILASGTAHNEARFPRGTIRNAKGERWSTHNECRTSPCPVVNLNSVEDFCLWTPSQPVLSATETTEHTLVAWCLKGAHGARLMPDGVIWGARLVITPEYVQITGTGNLTAIHVPSDGVASASSQSGRLHGLVFTSAYGQVEHISDWTSFVSRERFCFRACRPSATASASCPPVHDVFGCLEDVPGAYDSGVFEDCIGDAREVPSTLFQGVLGASSYDATHPPLSCVTRASNRGARATRARRVPPSTLDLALVTSVSQGQQSAPLASATTTDNSTTITSPSLPTSTDTACVDPSAPVSSTSLAPTVDAFNHTQWQSRTRRHSRRRCTTTSIPLSSSSPFSSQSDFSSSSSATSVLSDSPLTSSGPTSSLTPTPSSAPSAPTSTPTPTSELSSYPSSSLSESSLSESSDPIVLATSSSVSISTPYPTTSSTTSSPTAPTASSTPISSSTSSQALDIPTFTSPSSSSVSLVPSTTSSPAPSNTFPNSQTQLGSQCPPPSQVAVNGGASAAPRAPFHLSLALTTFTIIMSSSIVCTFVF